MKKSMIAAAALALAAGFANNAAAEERAWEWSPLGVGLFAPVQIPLMSSDVYGLRFGGLLGIERDVYGIDAGLVEINRGNFAGIAASAFNWSSDAAYGIRAGAIANAAFGNTGSFDAGLVNVVWGDGAVAQVGAVNYAASFAGLQAGVINWNNSESVGFDVGVANANQSEYAGFSLGLVDYSQIHTGVQIGGVNCADDVTGVQIGVLNAAERMHGVQIGLFNMICEGVWPMMVVVNASF